jgi:hypothetical protein
MGQRKYIFIRKSPVETGDDEEDVRSWAYMTKRSA